VDAEIVLDPSAFEKYQIQAVPTWVLDDGKKHDKVSGNLTLFATLTLFSEQGDTRETAKSLLKRIGERP
jgi:hypothetical protein